MKRYTTYNRDNDIVVTRIAPFDPPLIPTASTHASSPSRAPSDSWFPAHACFYGCVRARPHSVLRFGFTHSTVGITADSDQAIGGDLGRSSGKRRLTLLLASTSRPGRDLRRHVRPGPSAGDQNLPRGDASVLRSADHDSVEQHYRKRDREILLHELVDVAGERDG